MRHLGLVLVLCGAAGLALAPVSALAFEIQGENAELPESAAEFHGLGKPSVLPEFHGSSLAMPFSGNETDGSHISDYGNSIAIPAPGVDQPTPAWASGPFFR